MPSVRLLRLPRSALLGCLLLAACSSKTADSATGPSKGADAGPNADAGGVACTTRGAECLASQQRCASDGKTETCVPCGDGEYAKDQNTCAKIPGTFMPHDFGTYSLGPGEEDNTECQSWSVGNDTELWINGVEFATSGGYHHSNWLFVPDTMFSGPDGMWKCNDRGYSELGAAVAGGVIFAQSTQAKHQVQKFPDGVAVRLPPHVKIIGGVHLLNLGTDPTDTTLSFSLYSIDKKDVTVPLAPFRLSYLDLTIPPQAISEFSASCDLSAAVPGGTPGDLDMDLYYVMPHYHVLGHSFHLGVYGGPNDGKAIFDLGAFDSEAHGTPIDPPLSMRGSQGFDFTCGYENPGTAQVGWGIGSQEMCVMLGFARSDYSFDASVLTGNSKELPKKGSTFEYGGTCGVLALKTGQASGSTDAGADAAH